MTASPEKNDCTELACRFPNLNLEALFMEASKTYKSDFCMEKIQDLIALAELYNICDYVREFDIHGSLPVMYVEISEGTKTNLERIYLEKFTYNGKPRLSIWGEHWDPKVLNPDMETYPDATGNYYIKLD